MAYDEGLCERVRDVIAIRAGVTERKMFSALAWFVDGNMACAVLDDELMVRLGKEGAERALAEPHVRQFTSGKGKPMGGFVLVAPPAIADDEDLARWVDAGAEFAATLPPK